METLRWLSAAALAVPLFAATNVDDLFILVGFFAQRQFRTREIVLGQYLGIAALCMLSLALGLAAAAISGRYIGLLGVLPIALGIRHLVQLRGQRGPDDAAGAAALAGAPLRRALAVSMVTVANGGDNVGAYGPLFATRSTFEILATVATFAVMTGLWCLTARWLVAHRTLGAPIRRYGHFVLPVALMAIGFLILRQSGVLSLAR
jgi:cadmium resistance protein CadD (predicted permease)